MNPYGVSEEKAQALLARMASLQIRENDVVEIFTRGSGKGGQKINKTSVCVLLQHAPSGVEVRCQKARSQALNRFLARRLLCDKVEAIVRGKESAQAREKHKIQKQKARRTRRTKAKLIANKRARGALKQLRKASQDS
jgi:protein subunit release factor B